jgi:tetratricopeptide (TPR) repeat protein
VLSRLGAYRLASLLVASAYRQDPSNPDAILYRAYYLYADGGPLASYFFIREKIPAMGDTPHRADVLAHLAVLSGVFRDFQKAELRISEALSISSGHRHWLLVEKAVLRRMEDRVEESLELAQEALRLHPFFRPAVEHAAGLMCRLGRDEEAIELLSSAAQQGESKALWAQLGAIHSERDEHAEALEAYEKAEACAVLRESGLSQWYDGVRANLLHLMGRRREAAAVAGRLKKKVHREFARRLESGEP